MIGVLPTRAPSMETVAHGTALTVSEPVPEPLEAAAFGFEGDLGLEALGDLVSFATTVVATSAIFVEGSVSGTSMPAS